MTSLHRRVLTAQKSFISSEPDTSFQLPYMFEKRDYQKETWDNLDSHKRSIIIWHRRAGKDKLCFNYIIARAWKTVGVYYYVFPTYSQAKKAIWEGIDRNGFAFLDHVPKEIIASKHQTELKIVLKNGSVFRLVGSDNIDALMGTPPRGIVFSEYAMQSSRAWDYIRPILAENEGWAIFNSTPRGKNHFYDLYIQAKDNPNWYTSLLTVDDTNSIPKEEIEKEKDEMADDIFQQEYYCSFSKGQDGSWYGKYLSNVDLDGRITNVPYDPYGKVDTFWDLGVGDSTSIIFAQKVGQEIHIIDHYESHGEGLDHYARMLDKKDYRYNAHYAPHDIKVRELTNYARTRLDIAKDLGLNFSIVPDISIYEGIEITRSIFHQLWFDEIKCKYLLKCLANYCKRYNEAYNVYSDQPVHNWASHAADAFRMLGIMYSHKRESKSLDQIEWEEKKYRKYI